jgi:hypothetical protein
MSLGLSSSFPGANAPEGPPNEEQGLQTRNGRAPNLNNS